ncbi:MAG: 3-isopropylmalate dehydratase [Candidatus Thermoplasmatota archaeon]|nr:3-isopropylmalate dehydratase [Candidatus Thermoplasmatota archaeon]
MRPTTLTGRVWVLTDGEGTLIDDIDTDNIFHNRHLHITEVKEMGQYALGNLEGWEDFPRQTEKGDILVAGKNFGAGSSRQQAVDCFIALGVQAIIAKSFGAIYKRNAINSGLPVLEGSVDVDSGQTITVDLKFGEVTGNGKTLGKVQPMSGVQMDIYQAGDLFSYGRQVEQQSG